MNVLRYSAVFSSLLLAGAAQAGTIESPATLLEEMAQPPQSVAGSTPHGAHQIKRNIFQRRLKEAQRARNGRAYLRILDQADRAIVLTGPEWEELIFRGARYAEQLRDDHRAARWYERVAANYPITKYARASFVRLAALAEAPSYAGKKRYYFSERFLRTMSRNVAAAPHLRAFLKSACSLSLRKKIGWPARRLQGRAKAECYLRLRLYEEAYQLAKQIRARSPQMQRELSEIMASAASRGKEHVTAAVHYAQVRAQATSRDWARLDAQLADTLFYGGHQLSASRLYRRVGLNGRSDVVKWQRFWSHYAAHDRSALSELFRRRMPRSIKRTDQLYEGGPLYWHARAAERLTYFDDAHDSYEALMHRYADNLYGDFALSRRPSLRPGTGLASLSDVDADVSPPSQVLAESVATVAPPQPAYRLMYEGARRVVTRKTRGVRGWGSFYQHQRQHSDLWRSYYPLAFHDHVQKMGHALNVDPFLVLSVMRVESAYDPEAVSYVGARGLMQLMPYTALNIARSSGMERFSLEELWRPEVNIAYGTWYLRRLLSYFAEHPILAIAAYNAGPEAVRSWWQRCNGCDFDEFIEAIPFGETRQYVKRVLHSYNRYARIYERGMTAEFADPFPKSLGDDRDLF